MRRTISLVETSPLTATYEYGHNLEHGKSLGESINDRDDYEKVKHDHKHEQGYVI
jgi:hypothetical protein